MIRYRICPASASGLVALLCLFAPQVSAGAVEAPWNLPALSAKPEDILHAAAASPAPKDGDVEMLFEEHVYKLDEQGRQHRTARRVYRFLTDKGVDDWSCTEADWSPWCEEKPIFRVRVITPDGQAHALDPESIGEAPAGQETPNLFSDEKLLRGPLPAIAVGAIVEEEIETREIRSLFDRGIVERFLLAQQYAVRKLRLVIDAPSTLPLKYEVVGSEARPTRREDKGRTALVFELGPLAAMETPEDYLPAEAAKTAAGGLFDGQVVERRGGGLFRPGRVAPGHRRGPSAGPKGGGHGNRGTRRGTRYSGSGSGSRQDHRAAAGRDAKPDPLHGPGVRQGGDRAAVVARDAGPPLRRLQGPGDAAGGDAPRGRHSRPGGLAADRAVRRRGARPAGTGRLRPCHRLRTRRPGPGGPTRGTGCPPRPLWIDPSAPAPGRISAAAGSGPLGHARRTRDPRAGPYAADGLQDQHGRAGFRVVSHGVRQGPHPRHGRLRRVVRRKTFAKTTPRWASRPCGSAGKTT